MRNRYFASLLLIFFLFSCKKPQQGTEADVRVRIAQDPESLNPVSYSNVSALQIINLIYQGLLTVDLGDGQVKPLLAEDLPEPVRQDSLTFFNFRIREEAAWSNGTPVTAADVAFTLKVIKCPLVNNEKLRPYFEFIQDVRPDPADPKKFSLVCRGFTPEMQLMTGDFAVLPEYLVDPEQLLRNFPISLFTHRYDSLSQLPPIQQFAETFNSPRFTRDTAFVKGSGGYALASWKTGQTLVLRKKKDWWGSKLTERHPQITAHPSRIIFRVIPDNTAALVALKSRKLDVYDNIPAPEFVSLQQDEDVKKDFQLLTPPSYEFVYIGINSRLPKFADRTTRQALAHLLDVESMIKVSQQSFATPTIGPVQPNDSRNYNRSIQPYPHNLEKAKQLLVQAGWQQRDGQWQKTINGRPEVLSVELAYKAGNTVFENIALLLQESAAKIGVPVTIQPQEGGLFSDNLRNHRSELFIRSMTGNPFVFNFKSILHTGSAGVGGGNVTGFGTAASDALIEEINATQDAGQKAAALKKLQQVLHDEATLLFLYFTQNRIAISKRFTNVKASGIKPGYDVSAFKLQEQ